jgi:hypothetical protein
MINERRCHLRITERGLVLPRSYTRSHYETFTCSISNFNRVLLDYSRTERELSKPNSRCESDGDR